MFFTRVTIYWRGTQNNDRIVEHRPCFTRTSSTFTSMGNSDEKQPKQRAHTATGKSKHEAAAGKSKHKKQSSFNTLGSNSDGGLRHSQWRDLFRELCDYKVQNGHCLVPQRYSSNPKLGRWVSKQRDQYRKNTEEKSTSMIAEQIRALNGIGFDWGISKSDLASIWNERLEQLREFKVQFGHCLVPQGHSANPKLVQWVSTQRRHYRLSQERKPSSMTTERIRELESIGFEWETNAASYWNERFAQLHEFKVQFGHCLVPTQYSANPKLGIWVSKQRSNFRLYQEGKPSPMTTKRIRELESIGFEWETSAASYWNERCEQLREFKVQFGHCRVPQGYSANPKLGQWVSNQRSNYRLSQEGNPGPMTTERIRELESIGFEWETNAASYWKERFAQLREFKVRFGHCLVSTQYSANPKLGIWVSNQRSNYRLSQEGKPSPMTAERIRELESIEFKWETSTTSAWNERFEQLRQFKVQFGHCRVPQGYSASPKLGRWVSKQRSNFRLYQKGKPSPMTTERIRELESVGFK